LFGPAPPRLAEPMDRAQEARSEDSRILIRSSTGSVPSRTSKREAKPVISSFQERRRSDLQKG